MGLMFKTISLWKPSKLFHPRKFFLPVLANLETANDGLSASMWLMSGCGFKVTADLMLYAGLFFLVGHFGYHYRYHSASAVELFNVSNRAARIFVTFILIAFIAFHSYLQFTLSENTLQYHQALFNEMYVVDYFTEGTKLFALIMWLILSYFFHSVTTSDAKRIAEFPILSYMVLCFSFLMISSANLVLLLLSLEGFSLLVYIMATTTRTHGGISASTKYFAFGTLGSAFMFWGTVNIYQIHGTLSYRNLTDLIYRDATNLMGSDDLLAWHSPKWAFGTILIGLLVKLGAAPLHQWIPDVYAGVSTAITSFYAIFVKFILFTVFLRYVNFFHAGHEIEYAALISLVVGCYGALRQTEIKRFIAYGSITHVGFLLSGESQSSYVYLLSYLLASCAFFAVLLSSSRLNGNEFTYLSDLRHIAASKSQWDRFVLVLSFASMAGVPPMAGFFGKYLVWISLLNDSERTNSSYSQALLLTSLAVSLIIIFYYMRIIVTMFVGNEQSWSAKVFSFLLFNEMNPNLKDSLGNKKAVIVTRSFDIVVRSFQFFSIVVLVGWGWFMPVMTTVIIPILVLVAK